MPKEQKVYEPTDREETHKFIKAARARVIQHDFMDGFQQSELGMATCLRTAITALIAGIDLKKSKPAVAWECVAEAIVMLQQTECRFPQNIIESQSPFTKAMAELAIKELDRR